MDPKIHNHRTGSCIDCSNPLRDGVRGKEQEKRASPEMHNCHHFGETQLLLARSCHGLVLLDPTGKHDVLQDPAGEYCRCRPYAAGNQETAQLRQGRRMGCTKQGIFCIRQWPQQHCFAHLYRVQCMERRRAPKGLRQSLHGFP